MDAKFKKRRTKNLLAVAVVSLLIGGGGLAWDAYRPWEPTDNYVTGERSGLTIYTDAHTGCQYLQTNLGGLTARLRPTGKHICLKRNSTRP